MLLSIAVPQSTTSAAPISHHEGNGSAAALVHLAQFANLPRYTAIIKDLTDFLDEFAVGVIAAGFTASPRVFGQGKAIAAERRIIFLRYFREHGIKAAIDVAREAFLSMVS